MGLAHVLWFPQSVGKESAFDICELVFIFHSALAIKSSEHKGGP